MAQKLQVLKYFKFGNAYEILIKFERTVMGLISVLVLRTRMVSKHKLLYC